MRRVCERIYAKKDSKQWTVNSGQVAFSFSEVCLQFTIYHLLFTNRWHKNTRFCIECVGDSLFTSFISENIAYSCRGNIVESTCFSLNSLLDCVSIRDDSPLSSAHLPLTIGTEAVEFF